MSQPQSHFFRLPYDLRRLIYEHIFSGRSYVALKTADSSGQHSTFLCSSAILGEEACLFLPSMPEFRTPDMRLLRTSKAFYAEASAIARQLWIRPYQESVHHGELREIADLIRTPAVYSFGRLSMVRLLKETNLDFSQQQLSASGAFVEILPPKQYDSTLVFKTTAPIERWSRESIDELDYIFYEGVLRTVALAPDLIEYELVPLEYFGSKGTVGRWLVQDVWRASDPERVVNERQLRAVLDYDGQD